MRVNSQPKFLCLSAELQQPVISHYLFYVPDLDGYGFSLAQGGLQIEFHFSLHFPILVLGSRKKPASISMKAGALTWRPAADVAPRRQRRAGWAGCSYCFPERRRGKPS